ncbi:polysaccharide pyruvyl transferase family protein [uncultured Desulfobacter sp.]|uniref:polysaccharide pyruvyl transferase family protein n=1 Tax=uncultured Desulfobacter sp. TaxID=240139 RepID=UPI0029F52917|nr:polysaccharide pyruvyl transferase family protein [uncultured Desulfobacter sp.]
MKKIGILTYFTDIPYFNDINPGTNLQAYSVFIALKNQYPEATVELIRYHSWWAIWRIYLSGMTLNSLKQDIVQFWKYYKFSKGFKLSSKSLVTSNPSNAYRFFNSLNYDAIYVGSDTVLELFRSKPSEIAPYWLDKSVKAKKIMLAASARDTSLNQLSNAQKKKIQTSIDSFLMLGIRDVATFQLINNFVGKNDSRLRIIHDPTLNYDIDYSCAQKYARKKGFFKERKPIICFHLLKENTFAQELAKKLKEKGFLIASLRPAKYADIVFKDLSPVEFAGIFRYFYLTLTHRFHDSVFCIKNKTPFLVFPPSSDHINESGSSKHSYLLDAFDIRKECFIENIDCESVESLYERILSTPAKFKNKLYSIEKCLLQYKQDFLGYIKESQQLVN